MRKQLQGIGAYALAVIVVLVSVFVILKPPEKLFYRDANNAFMADFIIYHSAGQIFNNAPEKIYSSAEYRKNYSEITGWPQDSFAQYAAYLYPPYSLALYAPLAKMPLMDAYYLWRIITGISTFLLVYLLLKDTNYRNGGAVFYAYIIAIASPLLRDALSIGQPTILLPLGIITFKMLAETRYVFPACLILILSTIKPHLTFAPILYLLIINCEKRLIYSLAAAAIIIFLLCCAVFGVDIWQQYFNTIITAPDRMHSFGETELSMANIRTLLLLIFGQENYGIIQKSSIFLWLASVAASIYAAFATRKNTQKTQDIIFAMTITASCVFGLWTHISSLTLLLIPLACMVKYSRRTTFYVTAIIIISMNFLPASLQPATLAVSQIAMLLYFYFTLTKNGNINDLRAAPETKG